MGALWSFIMSHFTGEATYIGLGDTDGFFSSYLQQPSDTKASLFKKTSNDFFMNLEQSTNNLLSGRQLIKRNGFSVNLNTVNGSLMTYFHNSGSTSVIEEECVEKFASCLKASAETSFSDVDKYAST